MRRVIASIDNTHAIPNADLTGEHYQERNRPSHAAAPW
jgi:hypothetical protein